MREIDGEIIKGKEIEERNIKVRKGRRKGEGVNMLKM